MLKNIIGRMHCLYDDSEPKEDRRRDSQVKDTVHCTGKYVGNHAVIQSQM